MEPKCTMLARDIVSWIQSRDEFALKDLTNKFKILPDCLNEVIKTLMIEEILIENSKDQYMVSDKLRIFSDVLAEKLVQKVSDYFKNIENIQSPDTITAPISWENLYHIDRFVIFEGSEKFYEVHYANKVVKIEGKEIIDPNVFRLRFYEQHGVLLPTRKGINELWSNLVSHWTLEHGEVSRDKIEVMSDLTESKELIIDYINNAIISDDYIIKEGFITVRDGCIYLPTNIIKRVLKKEDIRISLRKLSYILNDYMISGSIPLKVNNKSFRFWKFDLNKFQLNLNKVIEVEREAPLPEVA